MTLTAGSPLPSAPIQIRTDDGVDTHDIRDWCGDRRVVFFVVPGAFTPTCSARHLPGFIDHHASFDAAGVDAIACLSVNDAFVMRAWGESAGAQGKVVMLADSQAELARALGIAKDFGPVLGERAMRCAFVVDKGEITHAYIEEPGAFEVSSAEAVLAALSS